MTESNDLPFELTAESVCGWLNSIDQLSHSEKVNLLNGMLNELQNAPIEAEVLFPVLDALTAAVLMLSKLIEHMATAEGCPLDKSRKWMFVAIQLPKKLCFAYARLASEHVPDDRLGRLCIFRAMQILGLLIKRNVLIYEAPDLTLWKKLAELYSAAESAGVLTMEIGDSVPGLIRQPTIQAVVKHILLFYGCQVHQYPASAISSMFNTVAEFSHRIRLEAVPSDFALCGWNPDLPLPPRSAGQGSGNDRTLFIDTRPLVEHFDQHPELLDKFRAYPLVLNRLTAYQDIRRSVSPGNPKKCGLIIGASQAARFLNVLISRYRILELSGAIEDKREPGKLELVPLEAGNKAMASLSTKILTDDKSLSTAQLNTYGTDHPLFFVAKIGNLDCSLDEPVILAEEGQPPFFAIIRYLRLETDVKLKNLLLEKIDGAVYPVEIGDHQGFVIIRPSLGKTELFLPPDVYHPGQTVLNTVKGVLNKALKIEKFVEMSAHYSRYKVSLG